MTPNVLISTTSRCVILMEEIVAKLLELVMAHVMTPTIMHFANLMEEIVVLETKILLDVHVVIALKFSM